MILPAWRFSTRSACVSSPVPTSSCLLRSLTLLILLFTAADFFQKSGVECARQQFAHLDDFDSAVQVGENHLRVATPFPDNLAARPAGRRQRVCVGDDRDAFEFSLAFGQSFPDGDALGADRQAETRVLDVAARIYFSVFLFHGCADAEIREGRQRAISPDSGRVNEFLNLWFDQTCPPLVVNAPDKRSRIFPLIKSMLTRLCPPSGIITSA